MPRSVTHQMSSCRIPAAGGLGLSQGTPRSMKALAAARWLPGRRSGCRASRSTAPCLRGAVEMAWSVQASWRSRCRHAQNGKQLSNKEAAKSRKAAQRGESLESRRESSMKRPAHCSGRRAWRRQSRFGSSIHEASCCPAGPRSSC